LLAGCWLRAPSPLPPSAAYDLYNGGKPKYNTYLVARSLATGGPIWAKNMTELGFSQLPVSPPVVHVGVVSLVTAQELVVMDAGSGQLRFEELAGGCAGGWAMVGRQLVVAGVGSEQMCFEELAGGCAVECAWAGVGKLFRARWAWQLCRAGGWRWRRGC